MTGFTHIDKDGNANMVDVGEKSETARIAIASARVMTRSEIVKLIHEQSIKKGDVLAVARVAGISAAKKTSDLIPLCHLLALDKVSIDFELQNDAINIRATAKCHGKTGVEMEALTAASVAALTIYDMCKAVDREMTIERVMLVEKSGGKSGHFTRSGDVQ